MYRLMMEEEDLVVVVVVVVMVMVMVVVMVMMMVMDGDGDGGGDDVRNRLCIRMAVGSYIFMVVEYIMCTDISSSNGVCVHAVHEAETCTVLYLLYLRSN